MIGQTSRFDAAGLNTGSSTGVSVTTGAANTKGSYAELAASTSYDAQGFFVTAGKASDTATDTLFDIAIGAAASEQIIIGNLFGSGKNDRALRYYCSIPIPAGSRIAARAQSVSATVTARIGLTLCAKHPKGVQKGRITTYGANTADSGGVSIDPGATLNTKGAYSEIVASTTYDHDGFILALSEQNNYVRSAASYLVDVAVGAAGSEIVYAPDQIVFQSAGGDTFDPAVLFLPFAVPAGSRIAIRAQANITDATDRTFDAILYGIS